MKVEFNTVDMIYKGNEAREACGAILRNSEGERYDRSGGGYECCSAGYWKEGKKWVAYDNRSYCCWVEEFSSASAARKWIEE